jgi:hypothetical protein
MLPPGKYTVEVVMPPGYEIYKEEDKNLLIGDNFIAPVTQQFGGLGADIFIIPDQASVSSMYDSNGNGYNPNNYQNQTTNLDLVGQTLSGVPGFPGFQDPVWPCVGETRVVPDYLSLFPQAKEVAPFAGAMRPLCDRKEVILVSEVLRLHFDAYCVEVHRRDHRRLHLGIRSVRAAVRREVRSAESSGCHEGLPRERNLPRVFRPLGNL